VPNGDLVNLQQPFRATLPLLSHCVATAGSELAELVAEPTPDSSVLAPPRDAIASIVVALRRLTILRICGAVHASAGRNRY